MVPSPWNNEAGDERFDLIVLGAGPAGETVASRLGERGLRTALVEQELIGGECAYWACIPSKTLLGAPEVRSEAERAAGVGTPELRFQELAEYRDFMVRGLEDSGQISEYEEQGVSVFRGQGRFLAPGKVEVGGRTLEGERIVIATGSEPQIPPIDGLEAGIELSQLLQRLGAEVQLVETADRLLAREDERVSELIAQALGADGIGVHCDSSLESVSASAGRRLSELPSDGVWKNERRRTSGCRSLGIVLGLGEPVVLGSRTQVELDQSDGRPSARLREQHSGGGVAHQARAALASNYRAELA
ncbi:MAG: FAD-dependent oxidoreductase, partial [Solirubrobacteraceae bacterium]